MAKVCRECNHLKIQDVNADIWKFYCKKIKEPIADMDYDLLEVCDDFIPKK